MKNKWTILCICVALSGCGLLDEKDSDAGPADQDQVETPAENKEDLKTPTLPVEKGKEEPEQPADLPANEDEGQSNDETDSSTDQEQEQKQTVPETGTSAPPAKEDKPSEAKPDNEEPSIPTVANPAAITVMVNKSFKLPDSYRPTDLVRPNVSFVFGNQQLEKALIREEAARALENMFAQAKKEGITLLAASGFRSYETQSILFENEVKQYGYEKAVMAVAYPGTSEHQTGLAMDITSASVNYILTEQFGEKPEGIWLAQNAHKFGFILRYPKGKESITGYQYEPWHFRYVGVEIATEIFENNSTLEEYYEQKQGV